MNILRRLVLLSVVLKFATWPGAAADHALKPPQKFDLTAIDTYLAAQVDQTNRVGLSVAIVKNGELVMARGYGQRSRSDRRPLDTNTLFAIGSVTKQFTCAGILLLMEDGKLSVQDKVAKYYPHLTRAQDITLLDLMNHVSGYPDYYPLDFVDRRMQKEINADELLRQYAGGKLDFEPGSQWSYSNTGYILLGRVIEKVSGESLGAFLRARILQPLGMSHTAYELEPGDSRLAQGYGRFALSDPEPVAPEAKGWLGGAGGIYSTPEDLARWDLGLASGRVLKPQSYTLMTTARKLSTGKLSDYGCGLTVRIQAGREVLVHGGAVSGFATWNGVIPSTRSAVIMTCNIDGGLGNLPGQIFSLLFDDPPTIPVIKATPAAETAKTVFASLQKGRMDRKQLGAEFNHFLTDEIMAAASGRLEHFGPPTRAEVTSRHERGGMEVTVTRLVFKTGELQVLMYRMPDGKIEQFFVSTE